MSRKKKILLILLFIALSPVIYALLFVGRNYIHQNRTLSVEQIRKEEQKTDRLNKFLPDILLFIRPKEIVGKDARNGLLIVRVSCSDICPVYSAVEMIYEGITQEKCKEIGGYVLKDAAWGGYFGCAPVFHKATPKIVSSEITSDCRLKIITSERELFINTGFGLGVETSRCSRNTRSVISPLGQFVVFEDISGGLDTTLRVYSLNHNDTVQLDVFGTSSIFDFAFLAGNRLGALYGYKDIYDEQFLRIYDITGLFRNYPGNVHKKYHYFVNMDPFYIKTITLSNVGKNYSSLSVSEEKLKIFGEAGTETKPLKEYNIEDITLFQTR
ncbi:MAG: hypothetical protein ACC618_02550 [Patescibacteria group bacterium]